MLKSKKVKLICTLILIFYMCVLSFSSYTANISKAESSFYAKIMDKNVNFFSEPNENSQYILFSIPESYFVLLLNDENQEFYYACYDDIYGYVKKSDVVVMDGKPIEPFASSQFRIFALEGMGLYSSPYMNNSNILTNIPYLADDLIYYGSIVGESIPGKSNVWYYCKYQGKQGYVYSVFCDNLDITTNNEIFNVVDTPIFGNVNPAEKLSPVAMTFIVIGVSLPCIIVIYLLVKPTFVKDKILNNNPKIHKKKRHGDYYEFDESDLN